MNLTRITLLLAVTLTYGCATGVKFASSPVNKPLPKAFAERTVSLKGGSEYIPQDIVGNIISKQNDQDPNLIGVVRPANYVYKLIPITETLNYYHSRIQSGAQIEGSYLAFSTKLGAEDMVEITLDDIARASIEITDEATWGEIENKIIKWVKAHPKKYLNESRLWIKSVILTRMVYNTYTKINADASGQVGAVVGVKTGVYRNNEDQTKSVIVGFDVYDVDRLANNATIRLPAIADKKNNTRAVSPKVPFSKSLEELEKSRYTGLLEGKISSK